jgi:2'-5' RNA ligase
VPHITLARTGRSSPGEAVDTVVNDSEVIGAMDVRSVTLFRSDLGPGGAKYVPLAEILLAAGR